MLCTCTSRAQSQKDDKHVRYIYDRVASCVAAAINGIWPYNVIPVLYNLTCLLCLKIIRAEGRGEKEGKKQDGKEAKKEQWRKDDR